MLVICNILVMFEVLWFMQITCIKHLKCELVKLCI